MTIMWIVDSTSQIETRIIQVFLNLLLSICSVLGEPFVLKIIASIRRSLILSRHVFRTRATPSEPELRLQNHSFQSFRSIPADPSMKKREARWVRLAYHPPNTVLASPPSCPFRFLFSSFLLASVLFILCESMMNNSFDMNVTHTEMPCKTGFRSSSWTA